MKKFISILTSLIIFSITIPSVLANNISVSLNSTPIFFEQPPVIENGRTLVPMRAIFEELGTEVVWENSNKSITATKGNISIAMKIGSNIMTKTQNHPFFTANFELEVPAKLINEKTMVPLRAIAEALDCNVEWDGINRHIDISTFDETPNDIKYYKECNIVPDFGERYDIELYNLSKALPFNDTKYCTERIYDTQNDLLLEKYEKLLLQCGFSNFNYMWIKNDCKIMAYFIDPKRLCISIYGLTEEEISVVDSYSKVAEEKKAEEKKEIEQQKDKTQKIKYDKSFRLSRTDWKGDDIIININSFEIISSEINWNNELNVKCSITGTVYGDNWCKFDVKCYDNEGILLGTDDVHESVSDGEKFRFTGQLYLPSGTTRIEFANWI